MQKTITFGTIFYLCFICLTVNAQEKVTAPVPENAQTEKVTAPVPENAQIEKVTAPVPEKKNIVKINLLPLVFKNISLQYERKIGKRITLAANVHCIPFGKLPFQNTFKNISKDSSVQYSQFKLGSFGFVPEFRYYLGKKGALHGFYIGPFLSYTHYKMNLPINYSDNTTTKTGVFGGNLNAITAGVQLGAQFKLGKNMILDWWILGPNYGSATGTLNFSAALTDEEQTDLNTQLEKLKNDAPLHTIKSYTVSSTGASVKAKGPWGGIRGLGFSLGFRF
jgi:Protein of unknown function (DUF3575)